MLAREAEAASWSQRRQVYGGGGGAAKRSESWIAPTMGFPPVTPMPHFRPLHVWGHPPVDQSMMPMWPKHLAPPPPPHAWHPSQPPPPPPHADPSFWMPHHHHHVTITRNSCTRFFPCMLLLILSHSFIQSLLMYRCLRRERLASRRRR